MCKELAAEGLNAAVWSSIKYESCPPAALFNMCGMFSRYLMSVLAAVCLICIIHGICILPDKANELWNCVVFYVYMDRLVSSIQIPRWNMSGSACPVIDAHWSITERCLHEFGKEGEKNIRSDFWSFGSRQALASAWWYKLKWYKPGYITIQLKQFSIFWFFP